MNGAELSKASLARLFLISTPKQNRMGVGLYRTSVANQARHRGERCEAVFIVSRLRRSKVSSSRAACSDDSVIRSAWSINNLYAGSLTDQRRWRLFSEQIASIDLRLDSLG